MADPTFPNFNLPQFPYQNMPQQLGASLQGPPLTNGQGYGRWQLPQLSQAQWPRLYGSQAQTLPPLQGGQLPQLPSGQLPQIPSGQPPQPQNGFSGFLNGQQPPGTQSFAGFLGAARNPNPAAKLPGSSTPYSGRVVDIPWDQLQSGNFRMPTDLGNDPVAFRFTAPNQIGDHASLQFSQAPGAQQVFRAATLSNQAGQFGGNSVLASQLSQTPNFNFTVGQGGLTPGQTYYLNLANRDSFNGPSNSLPGRNTGLFVDFRNPKG